MTKYVDCIDFVTEHCCNCGMAFGMTKIFQNKRLNDHKSFYCPAGHGQRYTGKSDAQEAREELERVRSQLEAESGRAALLEREAEEAKRAHGRRRARIKNGVCPCCNRQFQNLLSHMRSNHPDFGENQTLRSVRHMLGLTQSAVAEEAGTRATYVSTYERHGPGSVPASVSERLDAWLHRSA